MNEALDTLFDRIVDDYARFVKDFDHPRVDRFHAGLTISGGKKYIKIIKGDTKDDQTTVWGFIVKEDDEKFRSGDILKAASWATPARNKPRGNVLQGDFSWVRWTGVA